MSEDVPLEPMPDPHGIIVDFGSFKMRKGKTPYNREKDLCKHTNVIVSQSDRRCWCEDCKTNLDPFEVVKRFLNEWTKIEQRFRSEHAKAQDALSSTVIRRAAKEFDRSWGRRMAPCCPHCRRGLMPNDFADGAAASTGFEYEIKVRSSQNTESGE